MKLRVIFITSVLFLISCNLSVNSEYRKNILSFNIDLKKTFPAKLSGDHECQYINFEGVSKGIFAPKMMIIKTKLSKSMFNLKIKELKDTHKSVVSKLLLFNYYDKISIENDGSYANEIQKQRRNQNFECHNNIPIPFFKPTGEDKYFIGETPTGLSKDFVIYLGDAKPLKGASSVYKANQIMPPKWEKGYSYGFAASEKQNIIIYWVAKW